MGPKILPCGTPPDTVKKNMVVAAKQTWTWLLLQKSKPKKDFQWKIIPKQFDAEFVSHDKFGCSLLRCYGQDMQALQRIAILKNFHLNEATPKKFSPNFPTQNKFWNQIFQKQKKLFHHIRHLKSTVPLLGLGNVLLGELRWEWTTTTTITLICRPLLVHTVFCPT